MLGNKAKKFFYSYDDASEDFLLSVRDVRKLVSRKSRQKYNLKARRESFYVNDVNEYKSLAALNVWLQRAGSSQTVVSKSVTEHKYSLKCIVSEVFDHFDKVKRAAVLDLLKVVYCSGGKGSKYSYRTKCEAYSAIKSILEDLSHQVIVENLISSINKVIKDFVLLNWINFESVKTQEMNFDIAVIVIGHNCDFRTYQAVVDNFIQSDISCCKTVILHGDLPLDAELDSDTIKAIRLNRQDPKYIPTQKDLVQLIIEGSGGMLDDIEMFSFSNSDIPHNIVSKVKKIMSKEDVESAVIVSSYDAVVAISRVLSYDYIPDDKRIDIFCAAQESQVIPSKKMMLSYVDALKNNILLAAESNSR